MPLVTIYLFVVVLGVSLIAIRKESSLLSGKTFFKFNLFFTVLIAAVDVAGKNPLWKVDIVILTLAALLALVIKNKLLVFKNSPEEVSGALEVDLRRVLIEFQKNNNIYTLQLQGGVATVKIARSWFGINLISFGESWRQKKVSVLKALIIKKYHGIFPRLTIHLKQHVKNN